MGLPDRAGFRRLLIAATMVVSATPAFCQTGPFGAFSIAPGEPTRALLGGPIGPIAPLDFRRLIKNHPEVQTLALHSEGGDVTAALLVAQEVANRKLDTIIASGTRCFSACAFIFLAGEHRLVHGALGVHQIYGEEPDDFTTQIFLAEILENLNEFGTPSIVVSDMLRTAPDSMRTYGAEEADRIGLNRVSPIEVVANPAVTVSPPPVKVVATHPSSSQTYPRPKQVHELGGGWTEELYQVSEDTTVEKFFFRLGMVRSDFEPFSRLISAHLGDGTAPAWTEFNIIFEAQGAGPRSRSPRRVSVDTPRPPDGRLTHLVTVENINGQVMELPPPPYSLTPGFQQGVGP